MVGLFIHSQLRHSGHMPARTLSAQRLAQLLPAIDGPAPAYQALADAIRVLIADGRLAVGTRLPSERELTAAVYLSRTTVTRAYAILREHGYAVSRQGSGTVATVPGGSRIVTGGALIPDSLPEGSARFPRIDLTCAAMAAPPGTATAYEEALSDLPALLHGAGYHPLGIPELRACIAARYTERGLATEPDEVMVTSGAVAGLAVAARALLEPGDRVLMDSPTYPNAVDVVRRSGARTVAVPLEPEGWDSGSLAAAALQTSPRAAVLLPDFHNPTGRLMGDAQRADLARALTRSGTVPIVDETLADLPAAAGKASPLPFGAHHRDTITVGSASKTFWGGLRIGWVRAPLERMAALLQARVTLDLGAPAYEQLVVVRLLQRRSEVLGHRLPELASRREALAALLGEQLPHWEFVPPDGGLSLWVRLPSASATALSVAAERRGVLLTPGSRFSVDHGLESFVRLPHTLAVDTLTSAVEAIAAADAEVSRGAAPARGAMPALVV
jgi:DNA-binding transcriptional MocR family regulator